jgi:hypothetical protein
VKEHKTSQAELDDLRAIIERGLVAIVKRRS